MNIKDFVQKWAISHEHDLKEIVFCFDFFPLHFFKIELSGRHVPSCKKNKIRQVTNIPQITIKNDNNKKP